MADKKSPKSGSKPAASREDRLKAALKANLSRRKAQAKARVSDTDDNTGKPER